MSVRDALVRALQRFFNLQRWVAARTDLPLRLKLAGQGMVLVSLRGTSFKLVARDPAYAICFHLAVSCASPQRVEIFREGKQPNTIPSVTDYLSRQRVRPRCHRPRDLRFSPPEEFKATAPAEASMRRARRLSAASVRGRGSCAGCTPGAPYRPLA